MRWVSRYKHPENLHCIIELQESTDLRTGEKKHDLYYVFMYQEASLFEAGLMNKNAHCTRHQADYLQDNLDMAKKIRAAAIRCAARLMGI